ncbi:MAG TPA: alpha-ketoacid dehydrogenase subunit beta [Actinomycetota bacterium]|nr:alpha-ketoacid dehydrogenase subunit beta [Actinomycetota bacterium]
MAEITMVGALNQALRDSLAEDDRTLVLGEDVGKLGGVFRVTDGLQADFGDQRVFDTPLAEAAIAGVSIGLALAGWRPVAEMQFDGFSYPALDQIISHAAKYRFRSRGRQPVPMVVRIPFAGGIGAAEHHSESPETYYAHTAGLKVVVPSSPIDAYHLLRASIADPDPVIFLEPKSRYWSKEEGELDGNGNGAGPIGRARVVREGSSCTVITYGAMVARAMTAAEIAAEEGTEVEVLDLRSLVPLDLEALAESVRKTGRAVVVHEAPMTLGMGAEVVARIVEDSFDYLEAPVLRVTGYDTPYPPATIERAYLPSVERILDAVARVTNY